MKNYYSNFWVEKSDSNGLSRSEIKVIAETPITLYVNGKSLITFMCSPESLAELALGFLYNEGIIRTLDQVKVCQLGPLQQNIDVWLNSSFAQERPFRRTSGCAGGYTSALLESIDPIHPFSNSLPLKHILDLFSGMLKTLTIHKEIGGIHSSAISDGNSLLLVTNDIGRHNTLDKLSGYSLVNDWLEMPKVVFTTGRISSEMVQKAAKLNAPILVSRSSPTSLSVELARQIGITIIGYARGKRASVYTHPEVVI